MNDIKLGTNRSFGIVFFLVFFLIGLFPLIYQGDVRLWSLIISIIFLILGILKSRILTPLNIIWFKFGILLAKIISPLIMAAVFFLVVTPIGLLMRIIRKDLLNLKSKKKLSYWIKKDGPKSKMKNQF